MSNSTEILEACLERLAAFSYSPALPIAWPGVHFDPPDTGMWLECKWFPNEPRDLAWDNASWHETLGFFQINVYYRPGRGQIEPSEVADALVAHFPKGLALGPVRVRKRAWPSPVVVDGDKSFIPVTVSWRGVTE